MAYSDNSGALIGQRLAGFVAKDPAFLWVTSGYFATSIWSAIGSALDQVGQFRLLLGRDYELERAGGASGEQERRIAALVDAALRRQGELPGLPSRADAEHGAALVAFLERQRATAGGEAVVKLWSEDRFLHAKAFVMPACVGIGSANFTGAGMTANRELVGWRQDEGVVAELKEWFQHLWDDPLAVDHTDQLIATLRGAPLIADHYRPHDVLIRALAARYGIERPPSLEAATFSLLWFQEDAVMRLVRLLDSPARGALLADAVGLGKTFMALGVIHHYLYRRAEARRGQGRPVLIVAPKSLVPMWQRELREKNLDWACGILPTQALRADFDPQPYAGADLVVIDEAHRLRGGRTWFRRAVDLVTAGERAEEKRVLLLTATPVNTSMDDLVNLLRVMTKNRRGAWAPEVADFERYLERVEKQAADPFPILDRALVRRSRADLVTAHDEARAAGVQVATLELPERRLAHVDYRYGGDEQLFDRFERALRSLALAPYELERFRRAAASTADPLLLVTQDGTVVDSGGAGLGFAPGSLSGLIAVGLLVRFQSSISALRRSLSRLDAVLARTADALTREPPRLLDLRGSPEIRRLLTLEAEAGDHDLDEPDDEAGGAGEDPLAERWAKALAEAAALPDPQEYDLVAIAGAIAADRQIIAELLAAVPPEADDGKFAALLAALTRRGRAGAPGRPALAERIVLIFTQSRDTARYLIRRLAAEEDRVGHAVLVDGGVAQERRSALTDWFAPEHRGTLETEARLSGSRAPRILVATDVLAEGHNLQAADCVLNYDLHFNPQVAVQRAGRVDRLKSPHKQVLIASFVPPESLERHIRLLGRLDQRFRRIHGLGLGDEKIMLLAGDTPGASLEQIRRLYRDDTTVLDEIERSWVFGSTDYMRQPLTAFLQSVGRERLDQIPIGVTSVRKLPKDAPHGPGVFVSLAAPADREGRRETFWRYYPTGADPVSDETAIFRLISCRSEEPRAEMEPRPAGPSIIDWDLLRRGAGDLAQQLTLQRSTAQVAAGGSERSRKLRLELMGGLKGLQLDEASDLLERLLQVDVAQYDGRTGWSRFDEARRTLKRAPTEGERRGAGERLVAAGLDLLGRPVAADASGQALAEVQPEDLQLVAYEVMVGGDVAQIATQLPLTGSDGRIFDSPGDQVPFD